MEYPVFNSKALSDGNTYDLTNRAERMQYFQAKLGTKIDDIKMFLDANTFVGYLLAKKQAGKGTYAKMVEEVLGSERFAHISVGDVIRKTHALLENPEEYSELHAYLTANYRGFLSIDEALEALKNRSQDKVSIPTEFLLCLLKKEIKEIGRKALFIDGLPRNMDQISYSLYFRDLINFRDDPDFFVLINVPREMIDARMKWRRVCPICLTSRNLLFTPTNFIKHDSATNEIFLVCDNKVCSGYENARYLVKEGDAAGISSIEARIQSDEILMQSAGKLQGIPKIYIESAIPFDKAHEYLEEYEIQPAISYEVQGDTVVIKKDPWIFNDDNGVKCCSTYAATFVVNLISQMHKILIG